MLGDPGYVQKALTDKTLGSLRIQHLADVADAADGELVVV